MKNCFVVGGAGFIGGHLVRCIIQQTEARVTIYDNFTSGRMWHLQEVENHPRLKIIKDDVKDLQALTSAMQQHDVVFHFASNPDIAKAAQQPDIDFWEGTYLTQNVLEAMRINQIKRLMYASGSGVFGDAGLTPVSESFSPMLPISTYGASKLACENLICAYCHLFEMHALAFRFANVVGSRQTHGVVYDFVRKLAKNPHVLSILGDGKQSKSYIHVEDVVAAWLLFIKQGWSGFDYYNVATEDYVTVKEIADLVVSKMKLDQVEYQFGGGARGWKGDIPIVRFNTQKIRAKGWTNQKTSLEALALSAESIIEDVKQGNISS